MIGHRLVVVADAHLGAAPGSDEESFLAFLDAIPSLGDSLLLAGDIYDFWFTYKRLIPRHCIRVTARLIELARRLPVVMIGGNHDRWGDTFWAPEAGIRFDRRQLRFQVGRRDVLAVHGDGLHEERPSAGMLNRILDRRLVVAGFGVLPSALGFRIAKRLGHNPADAAAHPETVALAAARQAVWAERCLRGDPALSALIMGHTHRPALREILPDQWYLNPGAWLLERRFALVEDSQIRLETFR
ncbi:MAG: UDP-2,3-diacylglucosamine diphosphatase [Gemmatimonadales bacterium]